MREFIRIDRRRRLENFLSKVETTSPPPHLVGRWTKNLIELYLGHLRVEDREWPHSKLIFKEIIEKKPDIWLHMYVHKPVQIRANAALKKLKEGNFGAAEKILKQFASEDEGKKISSEIQKIHRSKRTRNKPYNDLLDQIYKDDPKINSHELLQKLKKEVGKGVILRIEERNNLIVLEDGGEFSISGLKDQLSKRRHRL